MKLIEKYTINLSKTTYIGYSETDIIRNMCPIELGLAEIECQNESENLGYEGCQKCWNRDFEKYAP